MQPQRRQLLGSPHCYYLVATCVLDQPLLQDEEDARDFRDLLQALQEAADLAIYAYRIDPSGYRLVLQHREAMFDSDERLRERWGHFGGRQITQESLAAIRQRLSSLSGLMQTLGGRYSRCWHQRHGGRGSIWSQRFRACLLADDSAILAAAAWLERDAAPVVLGSRLEAPDAVDLTPPALCAVVDGAVVLRDEGMLGVLSPSQAEQERLYGQFRDRLEDDDLQGYTHGFRKGWAVGRPESLVEALARLGRDSGRGRSRRIRELEDQLGLCGIWG